MVRQFVLFAMLTSAVGIPSAANARDDSRMGPAQRFSLSADRRSGRDRARSDDRRLRSGPLNSRGRAYDEIVSELDSPPHYRRAVLHPKDRGSGNAYRSQVRAKRVSSRQVQSKSVVIGKGVGVIRK